MMIFMNIIDEQSTYPIDKGKLVLDEGIFIRIGNEDRDAFEEFYHLTEHSVYAFVLSIVKDHHDALDVMQDTYLKIRAAAHLYKPMGKPMAWVFTIARNLSMSKLRAKKLVDNIQVDDIENDLSFSYVTDYEDKLVLQAALKILNEQERQVILLHAVSGLAHHEIAKNLDMPLSTELSKYHRGLKKLKKHLVEQGVLS